MLHKVLKNCENNRKLKCQNDSLGLKSVYLWIFNDFSVIFDVFIKIHEYTNSKISITNYRIEGLCLSNFSGLG